MENHKFMPNVNMEEKEIVLENLKILQSELSQLENILSGINKDYNKYLSSFPNNRNNDFLKMKGEFKNLVEKEKQKLEMNITTYTISISEFSGVN